MLPINTHPIGTLITGLKRTIFSYEPPKSKGSKKEKISKWGILVIFRKKSILSVLDETPVYFELTRKYFLISDGPHETDVHTLGRQISKSGVGISKKNGCFRPRCSHEGNERQAASDRTQI